MKGMRVQSIIRELRGEKIDIIEYHDDPVSFAEKALQPAKVSRVTILEGQEKHLEVIVDDSQLSLAIGKKGQNVRLAAKLLGWKIDIKSEEEKRQEVEDRMNVVLNQPATPLESVPDLEPGIIEKLVAAGITTVEAVADMTPEQLEEVPGIGPKTVEKISIAVNNYFSSLDAAAEAGSVEAPLTEDEVVAAEEALAEDDGPAEEAALAEEEPAASEDGGDESATGPDSGGQSGDVIGLDEEPEAGPDSVEALVESGQYYEAEVVEGVEDAPPADEAEVTTHERPAGENENVPDEEKPGEQR
jgi:transcription termination/antitermination protein NusA